MLQVRYVRGEVEVEELRRAWITSPTDPFGPIPTKPQYRTVKALLYDGALIPGYSPGYVQQKVDRPEEVLDSDALPVWEWLGGIPWGEHYYVGPDGNYIMVFRDSSGSVVSVTRVTEEELAAAVSRGEVLRDDE